MFSTIALGPGKAGRIGQVRVSRDYPAGWSGAAAATQRQERLQRVLAHARAEGVALHGRLGSDEGCVLGALRLSARLMGAFARQCRGWIHWQRRSKHWRRASALTCRAKMAAGTCASRA